MAVGDDTAIRSVMGYSHGETVFLSASLGTEIGG